MKKEPTLPISVWQKELEQYQYRPYKVVFNEQEAAFIKYAREEMKTPYQGIWKSFNKLFNKNMKSKDPIMSFVKRGYVN